jgi:hypothetical protein
LRKLEVVEIWPKFIEILNLGLSKSHLKHLKSIGERMYIAIFNKGSEASMRGIYIKIASIL